MLKSQTTFYIFNESGIIREPELNVFCQKIEGLTSMKFVTNEAGDLFFKKLATAQLEFIVYNGYVMKVEGDIRQAIRLLTELDNIIDLDIELFVSPSQRLEPLKEYKFPRRCSEPTCAQFLDSLFRNSDYTKTITGTGF